MALVQTSSAWMERAFSQLMSILETIGHRGPEKTFEGRLFVHMNKGKLCPVMGAGYGAVWALIHGPKGGHPVLAISKDPFVVE